MRQERRGITIMSEAEMHLLGFTAFHLIVWLLAFDGTYLAEMMPIKCQCCLRSQLEKMELCGEDLLSSGNRG